MSPCETWHNIVLVKMYSEKSTSNEYNKKQAQLLVTVIIIFYGCNSYYDNLARRNQSYRYRTIVELMIISIR